MVFKKSIGPGGVPEAFSQPKLPEKYIRQCAYEEAEEGPEQAEPEENSEEDPCNFSEVGTDTGRHMKFHSSRWIEIPRRARKSRMVSVIRRTASPRAIPPKRTDQERISLWAYSKSRTS